MAPRQIISTVTHLTISKCHGGLIYFLFQENGQSTKAFTNGVPDGAVRQAPRVAG